MKVRFLIFVACSMLCSTCKQTSQQPASSLPQPTCPPTDTLRPEQIQLHAELVYDSISYMVIQNNSTLPVRTDRKYEFTHYIHNRWKTIKVNLPDTSSLIIPAGGEDTIWMQFKKQIGYDPIDTCSIGKRFYTLSQPSQSIHRVIESHTRAYIIDWNRCELIPDRTELTNLYVHMTAIPSQENILLNVYNHSNHTLICGNETDYSISVYQNNLWKEISYAKVTEDVAVVLAPNDSLIHWKYTLPYRIYHFKPGRYRITKDFSFETDYSKRFYTAAEFTLQYEVYAGQDGKVQYKYP